MGMFIQNARCSVPASAGRRNTSEIRFDKNEEPCIKGPVAVDGGIACAKLAKDKVKYELLFSK